MTLNKNNATALHQLIAMSVILSNRFHIQLSHVKSNLCSHGVQMAQNSALLEYDYHLDGWFSKW